MSPAKTRWWRNPGSSWNASLATASDWCSIGDYDLAACAGVHVSSTSEIGMLLVEKFTSAKPAGDYEVEFKVGEEAMHRSLQLSTIALQASELYGCAPGGPAQGVAQPGGGT